MSSINKIYDRQIGRNAQLFAESLSKLSSVEERYPYVRILISIIEQAHPEWNQAPTKDQQIAHLAMMLSGGVLEKDEVAGVVRVRDEERGFIPPSPPPGFKAKKKKDEAEVEESEEAEESDQEDEADEEPKDSKSKDSKSESDDDSDADDEAEEEVEEDED